MMTYRNVLFVRFDMANLTTICTLALCACIFHGYVGGRRRRAWFIVSSIEMDPFLLVTSNTTFFIAL